jgi:hypothetical protein
MKLALRSAFIAALGIVCLRGQTSTTTGSGTTGSSTSTSSGVAAGTTAGSTNTTAPPPTGATPPVGQRPIFLSGLVMMDDGSHLPGSVDIQSICGPLKRTMAHTTDSGSFGFQWGTNTDSVGDASQAGRAPGSSGLTALTGSRNGSRGLDPLANCELQAAYPGYTSARTSLYDRAGQDSYDVGLIVLHRMAAG